MPDKMCIRDRNTIDAQYWGPTTKLVEVQAEPDDAFFSFFIEFHQGGAYQLFQRGLQELLDEKISLSKVLPALQEQMVEAYLQSTTLEMFLAKIDCILLSLSLIHIYAFYLKNRYMAFLYNVSCSCSFGIADL